MAGSSETTTDHEVIRRWVEEAGLAFLYQDTLKSGEQSRFFKFVQREGTSRNEGGRGKR